MHGKLKFSDAEGNVHELLRKFQVYCGFFLVLFPFLFVLLTNEFCDTLFHAHSLSK